MSLRGAYHYLVRKLWFCFMNTIIKEITGNVLNIDSLKFTTLLLLNYYIGNNEEKW